MNRAIHELELERQFEAAGEQLTDAEKRELELKEKSIALSKRRAELESAERMPAYVPGYVDEKVHSLEDDEEPGGMSAWEREKLKQALQVSRTPTFTHFGVQAVAKAPPPPANSDEVGTLLLAKELPIHAFSQGMLEVVAKHQVTVIVGETGSGKTTQIPQYLHRAGYSKGGRRIGCTQPRRVAAMSVARRVAQEMGVRLGEEVGYSIRFEDRTSAEKTVVKYMTDGILLREFLSEPDLNSYSVLIIDEAHERTINTDIIFGLLKDLLRFRKDLKVIIASATLDADKFSRYFGGCPRYDIPGRLYDIDIFYTTGPQADYIEATVATVMQIHRDEPLGDILVFLTGQEEVDSTAELLGQQMAGKSGQLRELVITRIYSTLPTDLQSKIFDPTPAGARKVVLATNIAETSITIDNIVYVIDPGFHKCNAYNPRTGLQSLVITPISRASAQQRAGRAGRVGPGKCFRLYTKWAFDHDLDMDPIPEIQRSNLCSVVLLLKSLGIDDLIHFDFIDRPPTETLMRALTDLYCLGALHNTGVLTKLGRQMIEIPLEPPMARTLLASHDHKVVLEITTIMAMLSISNALFYRPRAEGLQADTARYRFFRTQGDHLTLLNLYNQWRDASYSSVWCRENYVQYRSLQKARDITVQLTTLVERLNLPVTSNPSDTTAITKAIVTGFFGNAAALSRNGTYQTLKYIQQVHIHPSSSLYPMPPKFLIFHELAFTTEKYMRNVLKIDPQLLLEVAPYYYSQNDLDVSSTKRSMPG
ncbi:MAG: oligonucleotide/oligosaccharide-binding fold domain-containing protein [archaeon]|nr:oligonucleotide/oligosaccharide-binding fold domain-containing protein [archaeon]